MKRKPAYSALLWYRVRDDVRIRLFCFYGSREFSKVASAWGGGKPRKQLFLRCIEKILLLFFKISEQFVRSLECITLMNIELPFR